VENIVCDVCGEPAVVHSTAIDHGKKTESHLCAAHAGEIGNPLLAMKGTGVGGPLTIDDAWKGVVDNLRGTANFTRLHGRAPSSAAELLEGMALQQGSFPAVEFEDAELREKVECMERLIGFCQTHQRTPNTPDEWAQFAPCL
jgi:hypothetical protein